MNPFPHIVIENTLPRVVYDALASTFPYDSKVVDLSLGQKPMGQNIRYNIQARSVLQSKERPFSPPSFDPIWYNFVKYHTSPHFFREVVEIFGDILKRDRPEVEDIASKKLEDFNVAVRGLANSDTDVILDCQIGINSPLSWRSRVRGPHYDKLYKIFSGLLYMRHFEDVSKGAELELYACDSNCTSVSLFYETFSSLVKFKLPTSVYESKHYDPSELKVLATHPYANNYLVFFLNSKRALHGVSPRAPTKKSRRLLNFIAEVPMHRWINWKKKHHRKF